MAGVIPDWLDKDEGCHIPLIGPEDQRIKHMVVFAGHLDTDECHWTTAVEEQFHPDDFGTGTIEEAADILREEARGELKHRYGYGHSRDDMAAFDEEFCYSSDPDDGVPVTVFER